MNTVSSPKQKINSMSHQSEMTSPMYKNKKQNDIYIPKVTDCPIKQPHLSYLKKIFLHFASQQSRTVNSFAAYQKQTNGICLKRWMIFLKQMNLSTLSLVTRMRVFQKYKPQSTDTLALKDFARAVTATLMLVYPEVKSQGYSHIGILNKENYCAVMCKVGVSVPKDSHLPHFEYSHVQLSHSNVAVLCKEKMRNSLKLKINKQLRKTIKKDTYLELYYENQYKTPNNTNSTEQRALKIINRLMA